MTTPLHAPNSNPSPELTSELNNLRMVVEARQDRGPEGDKALGTIQAAIRAAQAGNDEEARSIVAEAWAWVKEHLNPESLSENASELTDAVREGASKLGDRISDGWASLFGGADDAADGTAETTSAAQSAEHA
jgi:hypothetical protein